MPRSLSSRRRRLQWARSARRLDSCQNSIRASTFLRRCVRPLRLAFSDSAEGPWAGITEPFTGDWVEGPSAMRIGGEWFVYFDHYTRPHYYGAVKSTDLKTWADVSKQMTFPPGHRHGTVLCVPQRIVYGLTEARQ